MKKSLLFLSAALLSVSAFAEGYQVNNLSAKQTGMAHVGTAMKLGSESIFFNPAATAFQESKFDISAQMTGISASAAYRTLPTVENGYQSDLTELSDNKLSTPMSVYFNYKPIERLAVGVGFFTPNGSSMNWGNDWSGAHLIQSINLSAYTIQPTISFKICDRLSVGAGLMITWGKFDLSRSLLSPATRQGLITGMIDPKIAQIQAAINSGMLPADQQAQMQGTLAALQGGKQYLESTMDQSIVSATLAGKSGVAIGVNAGIFWDVTDQWSLAMSYRSRMNMKVDKGHTTMHIDPTAATLIGQLGALMGGGSLLPPLDQATFNAELPLPTVVTWAVSFRPTPKWEFAADLQWTGWSAYKELNVGFNEEELGIDDINSVKNYSNTLAFRLGGQFHATKFLTARAGLYVDERPVDSNWLNPETPSMTKVAYTAGLSLRPTKFMSVDLAYCFVSTADPERTGSYPIYEGDVVTSIFSGNYKLHAHVFSVGLGFHF